MLPNKQILSWIESASHHFFSWKMGPNGRCVAGLQMGYFDYGRKGTPRKTNMEPKNGGLEDDFPFQTGDF